MAVTAWKAPGTITEDTSVGTDVFTNPANVSSAVSFATIAWATGTKTSSRLKCTNFGFTSSDIAPTDSIDGIEFQYARSETGTTDNLQTSEIYIIDSASSLITTTNNADTAEWPTGSRATSLVGGATDKMGYSSITQADAVSSNFGISFRVGTIGIGVTPDGTLNSFQVRFYYTPGGAPSPSPTPANTLMMMGCGI